MTQLVVEQSKEPTYIGAILTLFQHQAGFEDGELSQVPDDWNQLQVGRCWVFWPGITAVTAEIFPDVTVTHCRSHRIDGLTTVEEIQATYGDLTLIIRWGGSGRAC